MRTRGIRAGRPPIPEPKRTTITRGRRLIVHPASLVVTATIGAWSAHNIEYARLWGARLFPNTAARSAHSYLGLTGLVLLVAAAGCLVSAIRAASVLTAQLARLRAALSGPTSEPTNEPHGRYRLSLGPLGLIAVVWALQLTEYLIQENLEARSAHLALPGFAVFAGAHTLAPVVHLAVSALLGAALSVVSLRETRLAVALRAAASALAALRRRLAGNAPTRPVTPTFRSPIDRWGRQLWARPPPPALTIT
jgi:hypothetical protein